MLTVKLQDVKIVSEKFKLSMQKSLNIIHKAEPCPKCGKNGLLEYTHESGALHECLFCDYTIE